MRTLTMTLSSIRCLARSISFLATTAIMIGGPTAHAQIGQGETDFDQLAREIVSRLREQGSPRGDRVLVDSTTALGRAVAVAYTGATRASIGSPANAAKCWINDGRCTKGDVEGVVTTQTKFSGDTLRVVVLITRRSNSSTARSGTVIEGEEILAVRRGQAGYVFLKSERRIAS